MRGQLNGLILFALICFGGVEAVLSQEPSDSLRVQTNFVSVPVSVTDRDGRGIRVLRSSDFKIFENGIEQQPIIFEPTNSPFTVMLLVDVSGSMSTYMSHVGKALDTFIERLRPDDTFTVAFFSSQSTLHIRIPLTKKRDYRYLEPEQPKTSARGRGSSFTMTLDAVDNAIKYMSLIKGRRAIVLFGDADPSGRHASVASNLRNAEEQEAVFYTVRYGEYPGACIQTTSDLALRSQSISPDDEIVTKADLRNLGHQGCHYRKNEIPKLIRAVDAHFMGLAEKTGGRGYKINEISDLSATFSQIVSELGQQYLIGYEPHEPARPGERRKITVKVNIPNAVVRARREVVFTSPK
ncbi:MAG: VWA domain-containing protein [Pyrinomonadaceae bacterium]